MKALENAIFDAVRYKRTIPARIRAKFLNDTFKGIISSTRRNSNGFTTKEGRPLPELLRAWGFDDVIKIS
jgi:hypothetical protein